MAAGNSSALENGAVLENAAVLPGVGPPTGRVVSLLTYCDDATGERVELSAATLGEWASRSAALLQHGCGLRAGSRVALLLPAHWQTAAIVLGAWSAGMSVSFRSWATAGLRPGPGEEG